jgi:hypothetical protein
MAPIRAYRAEELKREIPGWGVDQKMEDRPGVPMEPEPRAYSGAHWVTPERQKPRVTILKRVNLSELTPVFGTTLPPRGLSGILRKAAYQIPEHRPSHWATLLVADRVDVAERAISGVGAGRVLLSLSAIALAGLGILRRKQNPKTGPQV